MRHRHQPAYRRRGTRKRPSAANARKRPVLPALLAMAVVFGGLALLLLFVRESEATTLGERQQDPSAVATTATGGDGGSLSERTAPRSHVTFGAHTSASQACETCHPGAPTDEIVCRSCHGDSCGKDSKTVADCLACHETGTTDRWVVDEP